MVEPLFDSEGNVTEILEDVVTGSRGLLGFTLGSIIILMIAIFTVTFLILIIRKIMEQVELH